MSASLVRKGLQIVDSQLENKPSKKKSKSEVFQLVKKDQKLFTKGYKQKGKEIKVNLLSTEKKITVSEARKTIKSKEQILQDNLRKLDLIRKASKVDLDKKLVKKIIDRAVTRRPTKAVESSKAKQTAFTEEDFKKFEEEYFDE